MQSISFSIIILRSTWPASHHDADSPRSVGSCIEAHSTAEASSPASPHTTARWWLRAADNTASGDPGTGTPAR